MFRISFMVEDRRLPEVLRLLVVGDLAGKVVNMEAPQLVTLENSVKSNVVEERHVEQRQSKRSAGRRGFDWSKFPLPKAGTEFDSTELNKRAVSVGFVKGSLYHVHKMLTAAGRLELVEERGGTPGGNLWRAI